MPRQILYWNYMCIFADSDPTKLKNQKLYFFHQKSEIKFVKEKL